MRPCCYCQMEATHFEEDPCPPPVDSDRKKKDRHYCNRHAAERLLEHYEARISQITEEV